MCVQNDLFEWRNYFVYLFLDFVESIWHTELDFLVPHRDRLVILSFTTSPYQNNSIQEENFIKHYHQQRPTFIDEEDDELAHTHLIEKFHSGSFDDNDYFDTHEKLENERTTSSSSSSITIAPPAATASKSGSNDMSRTVTTTTTPSNIVTNIETNEKQMYGENVGIQMTGNNRKQHARMRNRNNGTTGGGRGTNRKHSNANRDRANDNVVRKEKNMRRGDDLRENFETKVNNKLELDKNNDEFGSAAGGNGMGGKQQQRKYVTKIDPTDELPPDNEHELNGNRKSSIARDSNIHIVKPAEGTFIPSTPFSTDSKIIEIKPSTMRASKRYRRSSETIDTRMQIESDGIEDEFGAFSDADVPREPRIYVNFENSEQYTENDDADDDNLLKPALAALIDTAVPANVTPITATSTTKQLHGFAACLQHYLNVNKEIGRKIIEHIRTQNTYINHSIF